MGSCLSRKATAPLPVPMEKHMNGPDHAAGGFLHSPVSSSFSILFPHQSADWRRFFYFSASPAAERHMKSMRRFEFLSSVPSSGGYRLLLFH